MFSPTDTIVAIATPPGRGGIGVVRLSGPAAHDIARRLIDRTEPLEPRRATFARVADRGAAGASPAILDEVVVTWFQAPRSFTGDEVVEIGAHGSPVLLGRIVDLAMAAGARLAEPGEFTFRAYLNGRIDLIQAEAVADLVNAVTPLQARVAMDQLEGTLTAAIRRVDAALFDLAARLEASLDFPDEGFHFVTRSQAAEDLGRVGADLEALARTGATGRVIREGRLVAIVGRPNVGKSSVFNALAGSARAIVTDIPGTTRDMLTEIVDIGGLALTFVDTAGIRDAGDAVEIEGVRRARDVQRVAALTLLVFDASEPPTEDDRRLAADVHGPRVVVANKIDLPDAWAGAEMDDVSQDVVRVSAKTGEGLDALRARVVRELAGAADLRDTPAITNLRHLRQVDRAIEATKTAETAMMGGATEELILAELAEARRALEEITGRRTPDDVLRHIFERFCVGK